MPKPYVRRNLLDRFERTMEDFASLERQREYKRKVPFVHIPIELRELWGEQIRALDNRVYHGVEFWPGELADFRRHDRLLDEVYASWEWVPDVPEIHAEPAWLRLCQASLAILRRVQRVQRRLPPT